MTPALSRGHGDHVRLPSSSGSSFPLVHHTTPPYNGGVFVFPLASMPVSLFLPFSSPGIVTLSRPLLARLLLSGGADALTGTGDEARTLSWRCLDPTHLGDTPRAIRDRQGAPRHRCPLAVHGGHWSGPLALQQGIR